jgi:pilus assembly protein Flp/PilA
LASAARRTGACAKPLENSGLTAVATPPLAPLAQPLPLLGPVVAVAPMRDRKSHTHNANASSRRVEETMNLTNLLTRLRSLKRDTSGQDLLEYALLVALIALVAYGAVQLTGTNVNSIFNNIAGKLGTAASGGA